jgi:uncharacterized NAD(P)/FAD-binding protein YdhS/predicted metal-dependent enzyme (double-stranded beta helix superfamily)
MVAPDLTHTGQTLGWSANASPPRPDIPIHPTGAEPSAALLTLIDELGALPKPIAAADLSRVLTRSRLTLEDVTSHVAPTPGHYARRRIARTDHFEVLVLTWLPGQGGGAHDHSGSLSGFMILQGIATETVYRESLDGMVEPSSRSELFAGEVGIDPPGLIHAVCNEAQREQPLVSLHVYAPPLPELRGYHTRAFGIPPAACGRTAAPDAAVVTIIGGGFSGIMVAAHIVREAAAIRRAVHIVIIDRQTALGEGAAYRTPDSSHVLNLPAAHMSAWPERPDDFLCWARRHGPVDSYGFLPRHTYGQYLHSTLFDTLEQADRETSIEFRRDEATRVLRGGRRGWGVVCATGPSLEADVVVLATGHRPPDDPLARLWRGPRVRYIADPWAELALAAIGANESVCLLGTGLTAIDVLQTLTRSQRTAPVLAISRRGLLPASHSPAPLPPPLDPSCWLDALLSGHAPLTVRALLREIRRSVAESRMRNADWRQVIDGLRPFLTTIWRALSPAERRRFLRHARPFWEVVRHRTAPAVADSVRSARDAEVFTTAAARAVTATGDWDGVTLSLCIRGERQPVTRKFAWVINCTGPGSGKGLSPVLASLVNDGLLETDSLGLGVLSTSDGRAVAHGRVFDDLMLVGTLRKPDLWESTAVPELRLQAAHAATAISAFICREGKDV